MDGGPSEPKHEDGHVVLSQSAVIIMQKFLQRGRCCALAFGVFGSVLITDFWGFSGCTGGDSIGWGSMWMSSVWPVVPACVWLCSRLCSWTCSCSLALFFLFSFFLSCLRCIWVASFFWDSFWNKYKKTTSVDFFLFSIIVTQVLLKRRLKENRDAQSGTSPYECYLDRCHFSVRHIYTITYCMQDMLKHVVH